MSTWNSLLLRDVLSDDGTVPPPNYNYCFSPDIIPHTQVPDPQTFFKNNYGSEVGQSLNAGQFNYLYTRVKNLNTASNVGGYTNLFYLPSSIFINVTQWLNNKIPVLSSGGAVNYNASCPSVGAGEISIPETPFYWDTPSDHKHYCIVGVCFPDNMQFQLPTSDFTTINDFVRWCTYNPNVSYRNLQILYSNIPSYARLDTFDNTFSSQKTFFFEIKITGGQLPDNTVLNLKCDAINVNKSFTVNNAAPVPFTDSAFVPAGFTGAMQTSVTLPPGGTWPIGVKVETISYVTELMANMDEELMVHAYNPEALRLDNQIKDTHQLYRIGSVGVERKS